MEMEEKKEVKTEEETTNKVEGKEQPETEKAAPEPEKTDGSDDKAGETDDKIKTEAAPQPDEEEEAKANAEPDVQVDEVGNGIPLSEVALKADVKAMIDEALAPLRAKNLALEKENEDLKEKLAAATKDAEDTHRKYEQGDFGAPARKGEGFGEAKAGNPSYTSYEDMWAGKKNFD